MKLNAHNYPEIVRLELTNQCNLSCPHCRHHAKDKKETGVYHDYYKTDIQMTHERIDEIFEEIAPWKPSVTLNVANEPLVAITFRHAAMQVKKHGLSGTFNTNGLLIDRGLAQLLVDIEFDSINISVDAMTSETLMKARGISNLDRLVNKVALLNEVRGDKLFPRIGVTFVETDYNYHEIPDFLEFWKTRADVIRITGFIQDGEPDVECINPSITREMLPKRVPCQQLFRDIVIRANGDITPCVITAEDPDIIVGNIFRDGGVAAVWNSPEFVRLRDRHNSGNWDDIDFCKKCDYWVETEDFREETKDGFLVRTPSPYSTFYNVEDKLNNWNAALHDRQGKGRASEMVRSGAHSIPENDG